MRAAATEDAPVAVIVIVFATPSTNPVVGAKVTDDGYAYGPAVTLPAEPIGPWIPDGDVTRYLTAHAPSGSDAVNVEVFPTSAPVPSVAVAPARVVYTIAIDAVGPAAPVVVTVKTVGAASTTAPGATLADTGMVYVEPAASTNTGVDETSDGDRCVAPVAGDAIRTRGATSPLASGVTVYVMYPALGPVPLVYPVTVADAAPR
jgi:hypothetical protein